MCLYMSILSLLKWIFKDTLYNFLFRKRYVFMYVLVLGFSVHLSSK